jgi:hypothetical protein
MIPHGRHLLVHPYDDADRSSNWIHRSRLKTLRGTMHLRAGSTP